MGYAKKRWKPGRKKVQEYAKTMDKITEFCNQNGIHQSANKDSYYFFLNGKEYRVSNHSVEASNRAAYSETGKNRELYHPDGRKTDVVYIHAGKTRIREIYNDLKDGYELDGRGNRKSAG